jgi:hypothetical protein
VLRDGPQARPGANLAGGAGRRALGGAAGRALLDFERGAGYQAEGAEEEEEESPAGGAHQGRQQGEADGDVEEDDEALEQLLGGAKIKRHDGEIRRAGTVPCRPAQAAAGSAWASSGAANGASAAAISSSSSRRAAIRSAP